MYTAGTVRMTGNKVVSSSQTEEGIKAALLYVIPLPRVLCHNLQQAPSKTQPTHSPTFHGEKIRASS